MVANLTLLITKYFNLLSKNHPLPSFSSVSSGHTAFLVAHRWVYNASGDGRFRVKDIRNLIDDLILPSWSVSKTYDDIETFKVVGACYGLICLFGLDRGYTKGMVVIWNPSIGKSFGIVVPGYDPRIVYAFGVCPVTSDPTVVMVLCANNMPWQVEVFTLEFGGLECDSKWNNGEPIFRSAKELGPFNTLDVYDPSSQQIKNLGISGLRDSFFMGSYKESLLLLDHSDLHLYSDKNDEDHIL
ncbi:hypothetical protein Tco_1372756, partial [Tanacetum coccineum]